jgi:MFS family permease
MVAVTAVFTGMGNGSLFTISVFLKPLIAELGWLRGSTAFGYTAGAISAGLGGIAMGYLSDRFSPRPVVLGGALCLGAAYLLLARQTALWQFYLFYCLLGGLGTGAFYAPPFSLPACSFPPSAGAAPTRSSASPCWRCWCP